MLTQRQKADRAHVICLSIIKAEKTQSGANQWAFMWRTSGCNHDCPKRRQEARAAFFDAVTQALQAVNNPAARAIVEAATA